MTATQQRRGRPDGRRAPAEHPVNVRLAVDTLTTLEALGIVDRSSPAKQIREALGYYFHERLKDPDLEKKIEAAERRHSDALAVLTNPLASAPAAEKAKRRRNEGPEQQVTLKISTYDNDMLSAFALLDQTTMADQIRIAAADYVQHRKSDRTLSAQLAKSEADRARTLSSLKDVTA